MYSRALFVAALACVAFPVSAQRYRWGNNAPGAETCRDIWHRYGRFGESDPDAVYCEVRTIGTLGSRGPVRAQGGQNGGVQVVGESRTDVLVQLVVQAQARSVDEARALAKDVSVDLSARTLEADHIGQFGRGRRVSAVLLLTTPRSTDLNVSVHNGPLTVRRVAGSMDLSALNGPISMVDVGGDVRARTQNGPLSITLSGTRWEGTGLDAQAQNGPLSLAIPRTYNAELETGTTNGPMDTEYPITVNRFDGHRIRTTLGTGGPRIRATTENGPLSLNVAR